MRRLLALLALLVVTLATATSAQAYDLHHGIHGYQIKGVYGLINFDQNHGKWAEQPFCNKPGNGKMKSTACGAAAAAIAGATLASDDSITPMSVAEDHCDVMTGGGHVSWYGGPGNDKMLSTLQSLGIRAKRIGKTLQPLKRIFRQGGMAVALMNTGHFTAGGHYVVIRAQGPKGYYIADPFGTGQFGHNNEKDVFTGDFLLKHGRLVMVWSVLPPKSRS